jgi:hypothetical protein
VPTVVGVLKPMILLPLTLTSGLSPEQIESVLAHELAHLRRRDHLVNLLQRVIESLLFFHPAVWWVSHRVREEREHCCDDLVVACGAMPLDYAKSLLRVAELSRASKLRRSVAAVSLLATGDKPSSLRQRIERLLGESATPSLRISPRVLLVSITVLLMGLASLIQLGMSDDQSTQAKDDEIVAKGPPVEPTTLPQPKPDAGAQKQFQRLNHFTRGHDIRVEFSPNGRLIAVANGNPTRIAMRDGTGRPAAGWKATADLFDPAANNVVHSLELITPAEQTALN